MLLDYWNQPEIIIYLFMVFAFSISFHETAHAYVSYRLGDPTAKNMGRITLDPLKHLDLMGTIMIMVGFIGWAKPVPIDPRYYKNRKLGTILVSLAGPVSNIILAVIFSFPLIYLALRYNIYDTDFRSMDVRYIIFNICQLGTYMNIILAVFNFLPIPPLDGSKILTGILPSRYYFKIMEYHQISFVILIILAYTGVLGRVVNPVTGTVMRGIFTVVEPIVSLLV
ncbi:MAG: site-2 protease family protein [Bacillota bacterium]